MLFNIIIDNYLIKYNNSKIKLDKGFKINPTQTVTLDNLNSSYINVLQDLKKQKFIDFVPGKCPDCYIITAPQPK